MKHGKVKQSGQGTKSGADRLSDKLTNGWRNRQVDGYSNGQKNRHYTSETKKFENDKINKVRLVEAKIASKKSK